MKVRFLVDFAVQPLVHRATFLATVGPSSSTNMNREICIAITNGTSTCEDAAIIATESAPPGLVARYAVSGSVPIATCSSHANPPHKAIRTTVEAAIFGKTRAAYRTICRENCRPMDQPTRT